MCSLTCGEGVGLFPCVQSCPLEWPMAFEFRALSQSLPVPNEHTTTQAMLLPMCGSRTAHTNATQEDVQAQQEELE